MKNEIIYLACPYSHKDHYMMVSRFIIANKIAAKLMSEGKCVFSPLSHTHPIVEASMYNKFLPRGWQYWGEFDRKMLSLCTKIVVVKLPYWEWSSGVQAEIELGKEMKLPIEYIEYESVPEISEIIAEAKLMERVIPNNQTFVFSYTWKGNNTYTSNEYSDRCNLSLGNFVG